MLRVTEGNSELDIVAGEAEKAVVPWPDFVTEIVELALAAPPASSFTVTAIV